GTREGYVDHPYSVADVEATLAQVSGDRPFARDFVARFIEGRDVADYGELLARAGFVLRRRGPGKAWLGDLRVSGTKITSIVAPTWPAYASGLEQDDALRHLAGQPIHGDQDIAAVLQRHKPGDRIPIVFVERGGRVVTASMTLAEDPHVEVAPAE